MMSEEKSEPTTLVDRVVYTPGPWTISTWAFNPGKGKPATIYSGEEGMDEVAICQFDREPESPETIEADARLIAAAPMMLEALRRIVRHQEYIGGSMASMSSTRNIAAQAIQHATGEVV